MTAVASGAPEGSSWPIAGARAGMSGAICPRARGDGGGDICAAAGPGDHTRGMRATSASRRRSRRRPRCCRNSRSPPRTPRPPVDSRRGHSCCRRRSPGSPQSWSNTRLRSRTSLAGPYRSSWSRRVCSPGGCLCASGACSGGCLGRTAAPRPLGQPQPLTSPGTRYASGPARAAWASGFRFERQPFRRSSSSGGPSDSPRSWPGRHPWSARGRSSRKGIG
jgi:hypothetical protein